MLGIVVVAYRNHPVTETFVRNQLPKIEADIKTVLVIVDNSSTKEESTLLARNCEAELWEGGGANSDASRSPHPRFVISVAENLGYARGNNLGFDFLRQHFPIDYVLFSNDDIAIENSNCISTLIRSLNRHDRSGAGIGPRVIGLDGKDQSPHYRKITVWREIGWNLLPFLRGRKQPRVSAVPQPAPQSGACYWISGAFMLLKADLFEQAGKFDPRTFLYAEEKILAERLKRIGCGFFYDNSVTIVHFEGQSTKKNPRIRSRVNRIMLESNALYYNNYCGNFRITVALYRLSVRLNKLLFKK